MGSYLGKAGSSPRPPAQGRADTREKPATRRPARPLYQVHRVQHVHRAQPARRHRPARRPPNWDPANPAAFVSEAWRRFPMKRPQNPIMGSLPSDWWESYLKRNIWSLRHPRATWSPVTVKISPPERRPRPLFSVSKEINSAGPSEESPGECGKSPVLKALFKCRKGRARTEEPLFPDSSDSNRNSATPCSAFKPLLKSRATVSFVARPGSLKRSLPSQNSDHKRKKSSCSSVALLASVRTHGPPSTKRNAISSSYSSSRYLSESWKRHFSRTSIQTPEWPLKKTGRNPNPHSLVTPGSSGQPNREIPCLQSGPRDPLTMPCQQGCDVTEEDPTSERQAGPSKPTTEATTGIVTDSIPETRVGTEPPESLRRPSSETVLSTHRSPLLESSKNMLVPLGCSQLEHLQGISSDSKPSTASIRVSPSSPTAPVPDSNWPSSTPQAPRSAAPPHPSVMIPTAPSTQNTLLGVVSSPILHLPASVLPVETSAHSALRPVWGPVYSSEVRDSSYSRISVMAAGATSSSSFSTAPSILTSTFKPIFGSVEPLTTMPMTAPVSANQASPSLTSASTYFFHGLATTSSLVTSAIPVSTSKDPGVDLNIVTSTTSNSYSVPSCQAFLLGASQSFPPASDLIFPCQHPAISTVHTVTIFSQVLTSAIQISPLRSTTKPKGVSGPLPALGLSSINQPTVTSSISSVTSALTTSSRSSPKSPLPSSQKSASQSSPGATDDQKQCSLQLAPVPSFSTSFLSGNSVVSPTQMPSPAQMVLSKTIPPVSGGLISSASIIHTPTTSIQSGFSSMLAGFPLSEASSATFEVVRQNYQSAAYSSAFGSTAPKPFAFGGLVTPMDCGEPEVIVAAPQRSMSGARQSETPSTLAPFVQCWNQSVQGLPSQITPLASITARKTTSGASSLVPFAQSTPLPGAMKAGSSLDFGMASPAVQGSVGRDSIRSRTPSFCIGTKSKPPRNREPGRSRRHHTYKK